MRLTTHSGVSQDVSIPTPIYIYFIKDPDTTEEMLQTEIVPREGDTSQGSWRTQIKGLSSVPSLLTARTVGRLERAR